MATAGFSARKRRSFSSDGDEVMNGSQQKQLWVEWSAGGLVIQQCAECGVSQHPPGHVCMNCRSDQLVLGPTSTTATLVAWSTVYRAPSTEFAHDLPYTIAIVRLSGGALLEARVARDIDPDALSVGASITLTLADVAGRTMPVVGGEALTKEESQQ